MIEKHLDKNIISNRETNVEGLSLLPTIIADSIDREILRIAGIEKDSTIVSTYILDIYYDTSRYTFFTSEHIGSVINSVFSNRVFRDWLMNLTTSMLYTLSIHNINIEDVYDVICNSHSILERDSNVLLSDSIVDQLYVDPADIKDVLKKHKWLVTVFMISQHLDDTVFYDNILKLESFNVQ